MKTRLLFSATLLILWQACLTGAGTFTTSGHGILVDGSPIEVRGINYQPAAIGENPSTAYPYGDYYWVGSDYPDRWARDMANFRKMGINVIRIYGWDPNQNHDAFLQLLEDNGMFLLVNRYVNPNSNWADSTVVDALEQEWINIATPLANHPAIMGFLIGNEVNAHGNSSYGGTPNRFIPGFWTAMNDVATAVKNVAPDKLVSIAITDDMDSVTAYDPAMTAFDFWGMQIYRGESFGSLFTEFNAASDKPLVITEFGHDAYDSSIGASGAEFADNAAYPAGIMEILWNEIRANSAITPGGCVFEYADEWWKSSGSNSVHDTGGWENFGYIDNFVSEEWWGIFKISLNPGGGIDILEPRAMFYRLAAMWNAPYLAKLQAGPAAGDLQVDFTFPAHLREQAMTIESSADLLDWTTVATNNGGSTDLTSLVDSLSVTHTDTGDNVQVSLLYDTGAGDTGPTNLLVNGDFETGTASGWITDRGTSSAYAQEGTYSLELTTEGGFLVPTAFQSMAASPGDEFYLSGYMLTPVALPAEPSPTNGLLKIVFRDASGTALTPLNVSPGIPLSGEFAGAESQPYLDSSQPAGTWIFSEVQATAPPGTVEGQFFLINVDGAPNSMYFDSVEAVDPNGAPVPTGPTVFFRVRNMGR